jgi:hypothetical protein
MAVIFVVAPLTANSKLPVAPLAKIKTNPVVPVTTTPVVLVTTKGTPPLCQSGYATPSVTRSTVLQEKGRLEEVRLLYHGQVSLDAPSLSGEGSLGEIGGPGGKFGEVVYTLTRY